MAPASGEQIQLIESGEDPFVVAKDKYGIFPVSVWEADMSNPITRRLKRMIGDNAEERDTPGTTFSGSDFISKSKHTSSIFNPAVASWILNLYAPREGIAFDPFGGGGTRAIMTAKHGLKYIGYELREKECAAVIERCTACDLKAEIYKKQSVKELQVVIVQGDARNPDFVPDECADFVITCPPYFNMEQYDGGEADLSMAASYDDFLEGIADVASECHRIMKPGAIAAWVVGLHRVKKTGEIIPIPHDVARLHRETGFIHKEEVILYLTNTGATLRVGTFEKGNRLLIRLHEYVEIFQKPWSGR